NNIVPIWNDRAWPVAFGFGLMHGFGFASVLNELTSNASSIAVSLFGFNVGVELGQLCIVLIFVPVAFLLRETSVYRIVAVRFGSSAIAGVAAVWLVERAFGLTIF
ncbi:MAG TPA: HupE/UreJ family protein, partial [Verrucomicrobiae bacterium]|nr:HupE/UreJ family protein [Verrucomicrobiae bacterium]